MHRFGVRRAGGRGRWRDPRSWIARLRDIAAIPRYNAILKLMLLRLPAHGWLRTVHAPAFSVDTDCLLPFEHYKLSGDLFRRVPDAVATGAYANDSARFVDLGRLLAAMERTDETFLCPYSERAGAFGAYLACGAAQGVAD